MKLSLASGALSSYIKEGLSDYDVIKTIKTSGFRVVDYTLTPANTEAGASDGAKMKQYLDELEMRIGQAHNWDAPIINPDFVQSRRHAENALKFCAAAGIPRVVVHPCAVPGNSREEFMDLNSDYYRSLLPLCEDTGVKLLIENIGNPYDPFYLEYGKDLAELVDRVGSPWAEACWDVGHANHFDAAVNSQYQSICDLGKRLQAIHFNDNIGCISEPTNHIRMDMHIAPYMTWGGTVNYDAVLRGLKDIGYTGTFNFEISPAELRRKAVPFVLNGETVEKLRLMPLSLWTKVYSAIYEIGRYMLDTYGLLEE